MLATELARADHPAESHEAAAELIGSGAHERMMEITLEFVKANPGATANELEAMYRDQSGYRDGAYGKIQKRLSDLLKQGHVYKGEPRRSLMTGKKNATWYPVIESKAA